ncbi:hypothetical protein [Chitinophaga sp. S165]|uniref:hypothetical protein n=1 Tax=Chitinophaga sp. S165 TaxID=2135462 RepID=UPI000D71A8DF|nr:hypothetical protein [Chitinophaga sp. S165]PWV55537.1 hypothetical protein C7475_10143 [Chitinophaga sp. S165]
MFRRLTEIEKIQLLKEGNFKLRNDIKINSFDDNVYYELNDGRIVLEASDSHIFSMFDSYQDFRKELGLDDPFGPEHVLKGTNFGSQLTSTEISEAITAISQHYAINPAKLNNTFQSLQLLDDRRLYCNLSSDQFRDKLFKSLLIYLGMVVIHEKGGKWKFIYSQEGNLWEPHILLKNGKVVNHFLDLSDEILEEFDTMSLYLLAQSRLEHL